MAKSIYKWAKRRRRLFSPAGGVHIFLFLAVVVSFLALLYSATQKAQTDTNAVSGGNPMIILIVVIIIVGIILMAIQSYSEYIKRTYDPTLALIYQRRFEEKDFLGKRVIAATCILNNKDNLSNLDKYADDLCRIDWILDFFEDIGFYVHGLQISPEVAHHHFYHYIRGYWQWTSQYVKAYQDQRHEKSTWEHIEELYLTTSEVETREGGNVTLGHNELNEFLKVERELLDEYAPAETTF